MTTLTNGQVGSIAAIGGQGAATLTNTSSSQVKQTGVADAHSGDVPLGSTSNSAPASATGATTLNKIADQSVVSVTIGGKNDAPIKVSNDNQRTVTDHAEASSTSGASTPVAPAAVTPAAAPVTGVTDVTTGPAVTASSPVTGPSTAGTAPASCTGHAAETTVTGSAEKKVTGPAAAGQPIDIALGQLATVTNQGITTGAAAVAPAGAVSPKSAAAPTTGGAAGTGLTATNSISNTALVDVTIGGSNYAPITVAIKTISTIFNAALTIVETAAGAGAGSTGGEQSGLGARATNRVRLDGTASVDIAGDNHSPITIVLNIAADLWNSGLALLGGGTGGPAKASATGLEVDNILNLLGRVSVRIGGSNYAPIDIQLVLENIIHNQGIATARSAADAGLGAARAAIDHSVSSGPASCLSLLSAAGVVNGQTASVKMPVDDLRRQVLAGNSHVVDVQGQGTARCSTGNVSGSGGSATSGAVTVGPSETTLTVVTTQVADTSQVSEPKPDAAVPGAGNADGNGAGDGQDGAGATHNAQVVVAVTKTAIRLPGNGAVNEDIYEWVVEWVPLYVIYPDEEQQPVARAVQPNDEPESETTTSMAGAYAKPGAGPTAPATGRLGLDLLSQLQVALLSLLAFVLLALVKRRLKAAAARKLALQKPQLTVVMAGAEAAD
ncbi:MAG TPA: hypothetical protein VHE14_00800 [Solirubrobacteraceae bacterium]|nr:hypothetical protein [Solirubrobacteraceae bacterium]